MTERRVIWIVATAAVALLVGVGFLVSNQPRGPLRKDESITVVIEKKPYRPPVGAGFAGVGIGGKLGLIGHRCVGLGDKVVVWPYGTTVKGTGDDLRITSEGKTVRLGKSFAGGTGDGFDAEAIKKALPKECRGHGLIKIGLNS